MRGKKRKKRLVVKKKIQQEDHGFGNPTRTTSPQRTANSWSEQVHFSPQKENRLPRTRRMNSTTKQARPAWDTSQPRGNSFSKKANTPSTGFNLYRTRASNMMTRASNFTHQQRYHRLTHDGLHDLTMTRFCDCNTTGPAETNVDGWIELKTHRMILYNPI